ncbi:unnamed protein product [Leptidea sinapis]|uniref:HORMA domain-containing protein n=1 Tax=Leptidea sinapis TaxID=189913 RepID=A0A5E4QDC2_9NEOP|nr:unnamed protein product [Leptidea sinapis]
MDNCFLDIAIEFLSVAFHGILYYAYVYPRSIFETRRKYSIVVYRCIHPEVVQYIDMCLKSITECWKAGQLNKIEFAITNNTYEPIVKFVFDLDKINIQEDKSDSYLIQAEQNMRAICLSMSTLCDKFNELPDNTSFKILLHSTESVAVSVASNPGLEQFPLIEVEVEKEFEQIHPMKRFRIGKYCLDTYVEIRE